MRSLHPGPFVLLLSLLPAQEPTPATPIGAPAARAKAQDPKPVYDEKADAGKDIAAALERARKDNKRVLIQWGANWCGWCKWLAGTMKRDGEIARKLMYEYEVVHVDVGQFDKHMDVAKSLGAEFKAIPFLTILDRDGKALVQQNTEPFEAKIDGKDGHDPKKLLAWLVQHQPTPWVGKDVLAAAQATAGKDGRRVFLHFGAPWCGWCHRLEDWMARPEIAAILQKDFVDCKIDNDRMVGGKDIYEAQLAAAGQTGSGIPWFVFLDADGKLLAHSTGPAGNTGFPFEAAEIDHFVTMLQAVRKSLTDADIATLRDSLRANNPKLAPAKAGDR